MKTKYFPQSSIMEAALGNRPSQAWRNILAAKDLVHYAALWRVGDEKDIKIWGDEWLPTPSSFSVQSPRPNNLEDMRVCSLIDQDLKIWNNSIIDTLFFSEEASVISNIPLSPFLPRDRLVCRRTKKGEFTVRSAYHLGMERQTMRKAWVFRSQKRRSMEDVLEFEDSKCNQDVLMEGMP